MIFDKKRKVAKAAAAAARNQVLEGIQAQIDAAEEIPDIAERILQLDSLRESIQAARKDMYAHMRNHGQNKIYLPYFGSIGASLGVGAIVAAHFALGPAAAILFVMPGALCGAKLGVGAVHRANDKNEKAMRYFFDALDAKSQQIWDRKEALVLENLKELAVSPKVQEVARCTNLSNAFLSAQHQELAGEEKTKAARAKPCNPAFRL